MTQCEICGDEELIQFTCDRCDGVFCGDHRLPERHDCDDPLMIPRPRLKMKAKPGKRRKDGPRWRCRDCRQLYNLKPYKCFVCEGVRFRLVQL